jgi:RNA polymerase sigma factor (sigma-70 family)
MAEGGSHPAGSSPAELRALLDARDDIEREQAFAEFLRQYSRLMIHVAKTMGAGYDPIMDRYAYAVEQLREHDFRRLRSYVADGKVRFSTWLATVARRLYVDHYRVRYGRVRPTSGAGDGADERTARRRLVDLAAVELNVARLGAPEPNDPESEVRARELTAALGAAVGSLSAEERLLLVLRFEDDLSAREIAEMMGLPTPFHVYRRLNHVLARLRQTLTARGIDEPAP